MEDKMEGRGDMEKIGDMDGVTPSTASLRPGRPLACEHRRE